MTDPQRKPHYNPAIDGLRGIAILAVWLFHLHPPLLRGGFLGVDAFFVLSGFLIHGIVSAGLESGRFSFREFYLRRVLRLLPNAVLTIFVTLVLWNLCLPPNSAIQPGLHGLFTLANVSNLYVWKFLGSYWGDAAEGAPLTHFWSLGIEEQFYLFFPAFLYVLHRARRLGLAALGIPLGISLAFWVYGSRDYPSGTFYLLPSRAWELLLGATAAQWVGSRAGSGAIPRGVGWAGLFLLLGSVLAVPHADSSLGAMALIPTLGTACVLVTVRDGSHPLSRLLSRPAWVGLGLISYSLYLWHWPLIVLGRLLAKYREFPETAGAVAGGILSVAMACLAYRWVEKPLRDPELSRPRRLKLLGVGLVLTTGLCVASWRRQMDVDPGHRFEPMTYSGRLYDSVTSRDDTWIRSPRYWGCLIPGPAADQPGEPWRTGGIRHGGETVNPRVVVFGSSHALMYSRTIDELCREKGIPVAFLGAGNGIPSLFVNAGSSLFYRKEDGAAFDEARRRWLREWKPETLFVVDRWDIRLGKDFERDLVAFLGEVCPQVRTVVLVTQIPVMRVGENENVRGWVHWMRGADEALPRMRQDDRGAVREESTRILRRMEGRFPNVRIMEGSARFLNSDGTVRYAEGRRFFYMDDDHLNDAGAAEMSGLFRKWIPER